MTKGEFTINVPVGAYNVVASKGSYTPEVIKNVVVLEGQLTIVNIQLGGEENMEYIVDISIVNCEDETIEVPDGCTQKRYKFVGAISGNPYVGKTVKLLSADGKTVLQTTTTDAEGYATFTDVVYGNYKLKITY